MNSLSLSKEQLHCVRQIFQQDYAKKTVWAFGSRIHGRKQKPFSDLDLVIFNQEMTTSTCQILQEKFAESDLPFKVDVSLWHELPTWLQEQIEQEHVVIQATISSEMDKVVRRTGQTGS